MKIKAFLFHDYATEICNSMMRTKLLCAFDD